MLASAKEKNGGFVSREIQTSGFTIYGDKVTTNKDRYKLVGLTIVKNTWFKRSKTMSFGWGNGYVVVNKYHPAYGKEYPEGVDAHGGITYSRGMQDEKIGDLYVEQGWCFGFDTAHANDTLANCSKRYVIAETMKLARQLEEYNGILV